MKRTIFALAAGVGVGMSSLAGADDVRLTAIMSTNKLSALEAAAVIVVADALGVKADFVISTGRSTHVSPVDYGPYMIYASRCGKPFAEVWKHRGKGWGEVAHSIGMHPGTFNKLRKSGRTVDQIIWMDAVNRKYGIGYDRFDAWRASGASNGRILELVARTDGNAKSIDARLKGGNDHGEHGNPGNHGRSGDGAARGKSGKGNAGSQGNHGKGKGGGHGKGGG